MPRVILELIGWAGIVCIALAIVMFNSSMPYPSYNAALPVAGAALVILCGAANFRITVARILSVRWFVAIGLVSYSWYLWHWPILSFIQMGKAGETSFILNDLGGGALAFVLACMSYRYVEQPVRRWRKSPDKFRSVAHCAESHGGLRCRVFRRRIDCACWLPVHESYLASHYGIEGKGTLDDGCDSEFDDACFKGPVGLILEDSHATVLSRSFAKRFDSLGLRLVSVARGSCSPLFLVPSQRSAAGDVCARLIAPFERFRARPDPVTFVIVTSIWSYDEHLSAQCPNLFPNLTCARASF